MNAPLRIYGLREIQEDRIFNQGAITRIARECIEQVATWERQLQELIDGKVPEAVLNAFLAEVKDKHDAITARIIALQVGNDRLKRKIQGLTHSSFESELNEHEPNPTQPELSL